MTILIENNKRQFYDLKFAPDVDGSDISSRVNIPGYRILSTAVIEKPHTYKTRRGDPRLPADYKATYSQLVFGIDIKRASWGLYLKMFVGIFSAVAFAMLAIFFCQTVTYQPAIRHRCRRVLCQYCQHLRHFQPDPAEQRLHADGFCHRDVRCDDLPDVADINEIRRYLSQLERRSALGVAAGSGGAGDFRSLLLDPEFRSGHQRIALVYRPPTDGKIRMGQDTRYRHLMFAIGAATVILHDDGEQQKCPVIEYEHQPKNQRQRIYRHVCEP